MKVRASILTGKNQPWQTEEIDVDEPHAHEVKVKVAWSGMCHSDEHLRTGDISAPVEVLQAFGVDSMYPIVGGHEGSGIVESVGDGVTAFAPGDKVAVSFIPACGTCHYCATGRQYLCDLGMFTLAGPMMSDFTWRYHYNGQPLNRMTQLGSFAEYMVVNESSLVKIDPESSLKAAALISCGISTGFGSAVDRAQVRPGEVVVVVGLGGVGSGAVQGARIAGAQAIIAVDPLEFKRESALQIGATHVAASIEDALPLVQELSRGRMADVVILTPGRLTGDFTAAAQMVGGKDCRIVVTSIAPYDQSSTSLNLFNLAMFNQSVLGTVFGSYSPRVQVPRLLKLYDKGELHIDEIITREYDLDSVNQGYIDLEDGKNVRGIVKVAGG